jgi:hypothetical protein
MYGTGINIVKSVLVAYLQYIVGKSPTSNNRFELFFSATILLQAETTCHKQVLHVTKLLHAVFAIESLSLRSTGQKTAGAGFDGAFASKVS